MVVRIILAGTPGFKSEGCQAALRSERQRLEKEDVWLFDTVNGWGHVDRLPEETNAIAARSFDIMGRKNAESAESGPTKPVPSLQETAFVPRLLFLHASSLLR